MKFLIPTAVLSVLVLCACSSRAGQLTGKWQKADDSRVTIEFTEAGQYYLALNGEQVEPQHYEYRPGSDEDNLKIGQDSTAVIAQVDFLEEDRIRVNMKKPLKMTLEYYREGHAPNTSPQSSQNRANADSVFVDPGNRK